LPQEGKLSTIEAARAVFIKTQQRKEAMGISHHKRQCLPSGRTTRRREDRAFRRKLSRAASGA